MPDEEKNSLKSRQVARVIDLLGEGRMKGPWNGRESIYFDGVQVRDENGGNNFDDYQIVGNAGFANQRVLKGFAQQQAETSVGLQLKHADPITRTISDENTDRCRVTVSVPALQKAEKDGDSHRLKVTHANVW